MHNKFLSDMVSQLYTAFREYKQNNAYRITSGELINSSHNGKKNKKIEQLQETSNFVSSIVGGRYFFEAEHWATENLYKKNPDISQKDFVSELLVRTFGGDSKPKSPYKSLMMLYDAGLTKQIDLILALEAIRSAKEHDMFPISVNISMEVLADKNLMSQFTKAVTSMGVNPDGNIVIEALEHKGPEGASYSHLKEIKKLGYKFAIDDFVGNKDDLDRIELLKEVTDYIKIDGSVIDGHDRGEYPAFSVIIDMLKDKIPNVEFVAERVKNRQHAEILRNNLGINNAQGWGLKDDFLEKSIDNSLPTVRIDSSLEGIKGIIRWAVNEIEGVRSPSSTDCPTQQQNTSLSIT